MANSTFTPGQTVYSEDGYAYEYCGEISGYSFVRDVYEEDFEGSPPTPWAGRGPLFEKAPRQKRDEEMAAAQERLKAIRDEEYELRKALEATKAEMAAFQAKHADFQLLIDYLEGRITHVVFGSTIADVRKAQVVEDRNDGDRPRAIGLFAVPNEEQGSRYNRGKVTWKANRYKDGSGQWDEFVPCHSEDEARRVVLERFEHYLTEWRAGERAAGSIEEQLRRCPWITPPQDFVEDRRQREHAKLVKERDCAAAKLAEAEAKLAGEALQ